MDTNIYEGDISFKEKYFKSDKEKRINRKQFFVRMIFPIIVLWAFLISPIVTLTIKFSNMENGLKNGVYMFIFLYIIYGIFVLKSLPNIIKKRTQDFNKKGTIESYILVFGTLFYIGYLIYIGFLLINLDYSTFMDLKENNNQTFNIVSNINNFVGIVMILLSIYLLSVPGTKGTNNYGEQKYYKLKFFG